MRPFKVLMAQPAVNDLREISLYTSKELREPIIAKRLISEIKEAVMSLCEFPNRHALVSDDYLAAVGMRKIMVANYIIFYVISEKDVTVTVVRILYARREWINILQKEN